MGLLSNFARNLVLPSSGVFCEQHSEECESLMNIELPQNSERHFDYDVNGKTVGCTRKRISVQMNDQVKLEAIDIVPDQLKDLPADKREYVINFIGNGAFTEDYTHNSYGDAEALDVKDKDSDIDITKLHPRVVTYLNYRGAGINRKHIPEDFNTLVDDGYNHVLRIINEIRKNPGSEKKNEFPEITLNGHSLGGAVATYVAERLFSQGIKVKLFTDRAPNSAADFFPGKLRDIANNKNVFILFRGICRLFAAILYPITWSLSTLAGWNFNAGKAYAKIPDEWKYISVLKHDMTVPYSGSLYKSPELKIHRKELKEKIRQIRSSKVEAEAEMKEIGKLEGIMNSKFKATMGDHMERRYVYQRYADKEGRTHYLSNEYRMFLEKKPAMAREM